MNIKKTIIFFVFFSALIFSYQLSSAETYPATCDVTAQAVISGLGGCPAIDCNTYSNICAKCCTQTTTQTTSCTSFSYSNWSTCQTSGTQTRTVVSKLPTGCTAGSPVISQSCIPSITSSATPTSSTTLTSSSLISAFTSSKNEIISGEIITLAFSGPSTISKYKIYFSCPKYSTGLNAGLLAASVKIDGVEYCNKDFTVPNTVKTQKATILSTYSKPLKITIRLKAYNSKDEYIDYKDVILTVGAQTILPTNTTINATTTAATVSATTPVSSSVQTQVPITSTATSLQEQINSLLDQIKILQQQLLGQQSSSAPATSSGTSNSSVTPTSSSTSASASESITETALSNDPAIFSYTWNKDLYYGIRNDSDVKALQKALIKEGVYSGEVTGNFFGLTRQAVIDFQKKRGFTNIPGTGYVGSYTRKVLNDLYSK